MRSAGSTQRQWGARRGLRRAVPRDGGRRWRRHSARGRLPAGYFANQRGEQAITPHLCHDMHNTCAPLNDPVLQGDTWLSTEVPKILASQAYRNNGVLFITWDEGDSGDGPIGMIVLSPKGKGGGYSNTIAYDHSSTLRTVQEIFGVTPLGRAATATDLRDLFVSFP